jgi:formate hydrogenlyase transcriptional activator
VLHFVEVFARRMGKHIEKIPEQTLAEFGSYSWPGNVRELQNLIERAVIRSCTGTLPNPLPAFSGSAVLSIASQEASAISSRDLLPVSNSKAETSTQETLEESERLHILRTLEATGWVNGGVDGAASRLGLKRTTLIAKMKKLGIVRPHCQSDGNGTGGDWRREQIWPVAK